MRHIKEVLRLYFEQKQSRQLIHHDHSAQFWKEVARVMPEYGECRQWLKMNGEGLRV